MLFKNQFENYNIVFYKIMEGEEIKRVICNCCNNSFIPGKNTIHCINCDRWYCEKTSCWVDFNDECWPTDSDEKPKFFIAPKDENGAYMCEGCDEC